MSRQELFDKGMHMVCWEKTFACILHEVTRCFGTLLDHQLMGELGLTPARKDLQLHSLVAQWWSIQASYPRLQVQFLSRSLLTMSFSCSPIL